MGSEISSFFIFKRQFQKTIEVIRPPSLWCDEKELKDYVNFLCGVKQTITCIFFRKYNFL